MSDEYSCVSKGKLKLKSDSEIKKKKKKKNKEKDKEREKMRKAVDSHSIDEDNDRLMATSSGNSGGRKLTKAELAFKQQQEKMKNKRILEKASMTHKQRVEKFNEHLDTLTEHFDIPKVSWTK